jgi:hypothetical protein
VYRYASYASAGVDKRAAFFRVVGVGIHTSEI